MTNCVAEKGGEVLERVLEGFEVGDKEVGNLPSLHYNKDIMIGPAAGNSRRS